MITQTTGKLQGLHIVERIMDTTTLELVAAAFDRLRGKIEASGCDPAYGQTVYFAKIDVLDILAGTWDVEEAAVEPVEAGQWGTF